MYEKSVENGTCVAMKLPTGLENEIEIGKSAATSAKTSITLSNKGSKRQSIVELLALSEVLKTSNKDIKFVTLFKACKECFQVYLYLLPFIS